MAEEKSGASKKGSKKIRTKGKKERTGRKHEGTKSWEYYEIKDGSVQRKRKSCPRCGPGTFLADHKNRDYCGRCGYTHFEKKKAES